MASTPYTFSPEIAADPELAMGMYEQGGPAPMQVDTSAFDVPTPPRAPVGFNPDTQEVFVNGFQFHMDDHGSAIASRKALDNPQTEIPEGYIPLQPDEYRNYLRAIEDPSWGRQFTKNFGIGMDATQMLLYGAAQAAGKGLDIKPLEEFGHAGVERNVQEISFNEPYQRRATDIEGVGDAGDWFVSNLGQLAPSIVETIVAAGIGAIAGTATGGPGLGTIGGLALGVGAKQTAKEVLKAQVKSAIGKKMSGEALAAGEKALLRKVGAAGGGLVGSAINSYALGVGDIFTEGEAQGEGDVATALLGALPYATSEFLPQLLAVSKLAKGFRQGVKQGGRGKRALIGLGGGVAAEGGTEAFQEALVMGATGQLDFSDPEVTDRLIDAFAAGAGMGGPLGFIGGAMGRIQRAPVDTTQENADLLTPSEPSPAPTPEPALAPAPGQGELFPGQDLGLPPGQQELFPGQDVSVSPSGPDMRGDVQFDLFRTDPVYQAEVAGEQLDLADVPGNTRTDTAIALAFQQAQQAQQAQQIQPGPTEPAPVAPPQRAAITPEDVAYMQAEAQRRQQLLADQERQFQQIEQAAQQPVVEAPLAPQQLELPMRLRNKDAQRQAKAGRANLLRRGQPVPTAEPILPGRPMPGQGELFMRRGGKTTAPQPTAQANQQPVVAEAEDVAAQQAEAQARLDRQLKSLSGKQKLLKGVKDAVQEQGATRMDVQEQTQTRGGVPAGDTGGREAAGTRKKEAGPQGKALKRKDQPRPKAEKGQELKKTQPAGPQKPEPAVQKQQQQVVVKPKYKSAAAAWDALRTAAADMKLGAYRRFDALANTPNGREVRAEWERRYKSSADLTMDDFEQAAEQLVTTPREDLEDAKLTLGENPSQDQYRDAIQTILRTAVAEGGDQGVKTDARDFLMSDDDRIIASDQALIIGEEVAREAIDKSRTSERGLQLQTGPKGAKVPTTRYMLLKHYGRLEDVVASARLRDVPDEMTDLVVRMAETDTDRVLDATKATKAVAHAIEQVLDRVVKEPMGGIFAENKVAYIGSLDLKSLLKKPGINYDYIVRGEPIRHWLNEKRDDFNWVSADARDKYLKIEARERTTLSLDELMMEADSLPGEGRNRRLGTDEDIIAPMSHGAVKMFVAQARRAFKGAKPKFYVFKSVADLKRLNPALYKEAAARRPQGDFDTVRSAGYAYDDTVFLFSNNIKGKRDLAFTLAHEVLGHLGMRAVFAPTELKTLLDSVYAASYEVRQAADGLMEVHDTKRYEAIEEVAADYAAWLDNSVLGLLRKAWRGFLNKLGVKFDDDMLRYMVAQSRRYVRTGQLNGTTVSAQDVLNGLREQEQKFQEGRYATASHVAAINWASQATMGLIGEGSGLAGKMSAIRRYMDKNSISDAGSAIGRGVEYFQSMGNSSGRSLGLRKTFEVFQDQTHFVRSIQAQIAQRLPLTNLPVWQGGPTDQQKREAGEMLAYWALHMNENLTDTALRKSTPIIQIGTDGRPEVNAEAVREAKAASGLIRKEDGKWVDNSEAVRSQLATGLRFQKIGDDNKPLTDAAGNPVYDVKKFPSIDETAWKIFWENREAVNFAAEQQVLAKMQGFFDYRIGEFDALQSMNSADDKRMTDADIEFLKQVTQHYQELYDREAVLEGEGLTRDPEHMQEAQRWLANVTYAMRSQIKFDEWVAAVDGQPVKAGEIAQVVLDSPKDYKWVVDGLRELRQKQWSKRQTLKINDALADMHLISTQAVNADLYARRTIMGAYVPFTRKGKYQVKIVAVDTEGNLVHLPDPLANNLPYFKADDMNTVRGIMDHLTNEVIGSLPETVSVVGDDGASRMDVSFEVRYDEAPDVKPLHETVNYDEFVQTLTRLGIGLDPTERQRVVKALTASHSTARKNLLRGAVAGWDPDVVGATAEHLEMVSHITGKNRYHHRLRQILDTNWYWDGNDTQAKKHLKGLQDAHTAALATKNDAMIHETHRALAQYQRMAVHTTSGGTMVDVMAQDGTISQKEGRGHKNRYRKMATDLVDFYDNALDVMGDPVNKLTNEVSGAIMSGTAAMQLGMSIATGLINLGSLGTHAVPYLAVYNPKNGYGGGFGMTKATMAVLKAAGQMSALHKGGWKLADPVELAKLAAGKKYETYGLDLAEYNMLLELTREGVLQANMFNAMIGTTRSTRKVAGPLMEKWMAPFTFTEQLNRRATALASYRLERDRMVQQGVDPNSADAQQHLYELSTKAVNYSQGEYAQYNRPSLARGNLTQFLFMYKQFVVITIEHLRNMGLTKEAGYMLTMLAALSGLKGLPFGEDLMDLVDTLAQKFGIRMAPLEVELARAINYVIPGAAPWVLNGVADQLLDTMISSRVGMGDLLPLTGALKAGADPMRELGNFFGPVYSSISGTAGLISNMTKYGAEVVGLREDTTSARGALDILRDQPIAGLRSAADALAYLVDGKIVNAQGQVVSNQVSTGNIVARMMGFYPKAASDQYDAIRLGKQADDYAKALKKDFVDAYSLAKINGDSAETQRIISDVQQWNRAAHGTPFYFRNFTAAANRVVRENKRSAVDRYLKTAPRSTRQMMDEIITMYGLNDLSELEN